MTIDLVDKIYEAAFLPDRWTDVLCDLARNTNSISAAMLLVDRRLPPLWAATENIRPIVASFSLLPEWYDNQRVRRFLRKDYAGFLRITDFSTQDELLKDYSDIEHARKNLSAQAGSAVVLPSAETVLFTVEREESSEGFDETDLASLDLLRPHLARASLMAARFAMQRFETMVSSLENVGLPAAVVSERGTVLALNALFEKHTPHLSPAAFDRLILKEKDANRLLQAALAQADQGEAQAVRSIPVPSRTADEHPAVLQVIPLKRDARDIFNSATALVVVTSYTADKNVPDDAILRGLFDLSAAEARLAKSLVSGATLAEVATAHVISIATARTQLAQIFRKTGTRQQSEVVALLKGGLSLK